MTVNVTLCSIFRNSENYLQRYFNQISDFAESMPDIKLHCIWGEGDSTDSTLKLLTEFNSEFFTHELVDVTHGGIDYGSVVNETRFKNCAYAGNKVWALIPDTTDIAIYVDSDIIWDVYTMASLIGDTYFADCVCPMVLLDRDGWAKDSFYNTYDFRIDNTNFTHKPPYHIKLASRDCPLVQVDSAGSCLVMQGQVANKVKFSSTEVIIGMCKQIRALDCDIWLNTNLKVIHE